jgi:hypothetical protein
MNVSTFVITLDASHAEKCWRLAGSETSWEWPQPEIIRPVFVQDPLNDVHYVHDVHLLDYGATVFVCPFLYVGSA